MSENIDVAVPRIEEEFLRLMREWHNVTVPPECRPLVREVLAKAYRAGVGHACAASALKSENVAKPGLLQKMVKLVYVLHQLERYEESHAVSLVTRLLRVCSIEDLESFDAYVKQSEGQGEEVEP